ncbi:MAG: GerW family sporulation protein [Clostridia bacterium]|nr:GerW family sporulation protein [Clostridia bacterium]MBR2734965.1 GerW family sporulation protein [Clostridia bacterium]
MNKIEGMTESTLEKIKEVVNADMVIGKPITSESGTVVIPVSKLSYGFAAGGSDFTSEKNKEKDLFGGGSGAGVSITPTAFLVISGDDVKLLQVESFTGALDRVISMTPDIVDRIGNFIKKRKNKDGKNNKEEDK